MGVGAGEVQKNIFAGKWGGGGGRSTKKKKNSRKGKFNEKNSCPPINPKNIHAVLKKIHTRKMITKKFV